MANSGIDVPKKTPLGAFFNSKMFCLLGFIFLAYSFLQNFNLPPWQSAHSEFFAFLSSLFFGYLLIREKKYSLIKIGIPILLLLFIGIIAAIQYITGKIYFFGDALVLILYILLCMTIIVVTQAQTNDEKWLEKLAWTLLISSLCSAIIAMAEALWIWTDISWIVRYPGFRRPGAHLGQPNHLGTLLIIGAASLIYIDQIKKINQIIKILLAIILTIGFAITESRTAIISIILLVFWITFKKNVLNKNSKLIFIYAFATQAILLMLAWPSLINNFHEGASPKYSALINTTSSMRIQGWTQLWEAAWVKPWFGWGLLGTSKALNATLHIHEKSLPFTYAHNIVLDLIIGIGFPLALTCTLGTMLWICVQMKNSKTTKNWYAIALLIPFGVHSLLEFPFAYAYFLVPAMIAIGVLEKNTSIFLSHNIPKKIFLGMFAIYSTTFILISREYFHIEEDFRESRFQNQKIGSYTHPPHYEKFFILNQLDALNLAFRTIPQPGMPEYLIENIHKVALRFPWMPIQKKYILTLLLNGNSQEAERQIKVFRAMHGNRAYSELLSTIKETTNNKHPSN